MRSICFTGPWTLSKVHFLQCLPIGPGSVEGCEEIPVSLDAVLGNKGADSQIIRKPIVIKGGTGEFIQGVMAMGINVVTECHEGKIELDCGAPVDPVSPSTV